MTSARIAAGILLCLCAGSAQAMPNGIGTSVTSDWQRQTSIEFIADFPGISRNGGRCTLEPPDWDLINCKSGITCYEFCNYVGTKNWVWVDVHSLPGSGGDLGDPVRSVSGGCVTWNSVLTTKAKDKFCRDP